MHHQRIDRPQLPCQVCCPIVLSFVDPQLIPIACRSNQTQSRFRKLAPAGVTLQFHINGSFVVLSSFIYARLIFVSCRCLSIRGRRHIHLCYIGPPLDHLPSRHSSLAKSRHWLAEDSGVDGHFFQCMDFCHPDSVHCFRGESPGQDRCLS